MASSTSALGAVATTAEGTEEVSLLAQIVSAGRFSRDTASLERGRDLVKEFVGLALDGHI